MTVQIFRQKTTMLPAPYPSHIFWKMLEGGFMLLDLLRVPQCMIWLNGRVKSNTRALTQREEFLARSIFGDNIDYQKVRIDECAQLGCRKFHFAYVGFQVINCWGPLSDRHFMHEMVHIWQYQRFGARYIPRALWAQRTVAGYNYGGIHALRHTAEAGNGLKSFNWEQQADIVADFFCLKNGISPRWCESDSAYLPVFEEIVRDLD